MIGCLLDIHIHHFRKSIISIRTFPTITTSDLDSRNNFKAKRIETLFSNSSGSSTKYDYILIVSLLELFVVIWFRLI